MMWWFTFFISWAFAGGAGHSVDLRAEQLMAVRSLQQMRILVGEQEEQKTFSQRCRAELRGNYLPMHCYRWLEKGEIAGGAKIYLRRTLDEVCERRLAEGIPVGEKILHQASHLSPRCQKSLQSWLSVKMYKMNRENTEKLFDKLGTGSVFESALDHANSESVSQNRIFDQRAPRRRLN